MPRVQCTKGLFEMQSEEYVCVLPSDVLLSYSDTWRTLIGQEHPSGHLVCGPKSVYVCECVRANVCVMIIKLSFYSPIICVFVPM